MLRHCLFVLSHAFPFNAMAFTASTKCWYPHCPCFGRLTQVYSFCPQGEHDDGGQQEEDDALDLDLMMGQGGMPRHAQHPMHQSVDDLEERMTDVFQRLMRANGAGGRNPGQAAGAMHPPPGWLTTAMGAGGAANRMFDVEFDLTNAPPGMQMLRPEEAQMMGGAHNMMNMFGPETGRPGSRRIR